MAFHRTPTPRPPNHWKCRTLNCPCYRPPAVVWVEQGRGSDSLRSLSWGAIAKLAGAARAGGGFSEPLGPLEQLAPPGLFHPGSFCSALYFVPDVKAGAERLNGLLPSCFIMCAMCHCVPGPIRGSCIFPSTRVLRLNRWPFCSADCVPGVWVFSFHAHSNSAS